MAEESKTLSSRRPITTQPVVCLSYGCQYNSQMDLTYPSVISIAQAELFCRFGRHPISLRWKAFMSYGLQRVL